MTVADAYCGAGGHKKSLKCFNCMLISSQNPEMFFFLTYQLNNGRKCFDAAASIDGKKTTVSLSLFTCFSLLYNFCFSFLFTEHSLYSRLLAGCKLVGSAAWLDALRKTGLCRSATQNLTGTSRKSGDVWTACQWMTAFCTAEVWGGTAVS